MACGLFSGIAIPSVERRYCVSIYAGQTKGESEAAAAPGDHKSLGFEAFKMSDKRGKTPWQGITPANTDQRQFAVVLL